MEESTNTVIIGAGQAGLAMSRCLMQEHVPHVVLEGSRIGERWRTASWDSLRLLTPNWQSRLPGGFKYEGDDPDGFMKALEFVECLEKYAQSFDAPIHTRTRVVAVEKSNGRYRVVTDGDSVWMANNVVICTGHCDVPRVPQVASGLASDVAQIHSVRYKNVAELDDGGVLVVGAGASGVQIAEELARAGRKVTLAVGTHTRLPRRYRKRDTLWWVDNMGGFLAPANQEIEQQFPGPQLTGAQPPHSVDLNAIQRLGVRLVGKVIAMDGHHVRFDDGLAERVKKADDEVMEVLAKIDEFATKSGLDDTVDPVGDKEALSPTQLGPTVKEMDLVKENIRTVLWSTGFCRRYPFLKIPSALDKNGDIVNTGGIGAEPGLYVLGMRWMRRKGSHLIDGVGHDAADLTRHLVERNKASGS